VSGQVGEIEAIVSELRALAARPVNDFTCSWWDDTAGLLAELDGITAAGLATLFLPTSGMQELAISSGWGSELNALADRFEAL
jgi:hypothetical protein